MGNPFDGDGVKNLLINITEEDVRATEAYSAAKTVKELNARMIFMRKRSEERSGADG